MPTDANTIEREAADWLARRDRGLTAEEVQTLARWLEADPRHGAALAALTEEWRRLDRTNELPDLVEMARQLEAETAVRPATRRGSHRAAWSVAWVAAAAVVVLAAVLQWRRPTPVATPEPVASYQMVPNAAHTLTLPDGSVAELREDSEIRPMFTAAERRVVLVRGEALFQVTKNPARPFVVVAGPVAVRAVGTAFNVRLGEAAVDVLVTEGRVRVDGAVAEAAAPATSLLPAAPGGEPPVLAAGERVQIALATGAPVSAKAIARVDSSEVERELAWRSAWLVFARTPLEEAVAAFNRQAGTGGLRLEIADEALRARRLGGTFRADNPAGFVRLLEQGFDIRAEEREGRIRLHAAR